jgi:hypothetical protein
LAERFRAHEFALLRRCKVALGRSFMRSFWVFFAPLAGWSPKALLIGALNSEKRGALLPKALVR